MKIFYLFGILLCIAVTGPRVEFVGRINGSGVGPFTLVSSATTNDAGVDSTTITINVTNVAAGNLVVVWLKHESTATTIASISDGTSTFTLKSYQTNLLNDAAGEFGYLLSSVASGTVTYTITTTGSKPWKVVDIFVYSYTGTCSFDVEKVGTIANNSAPTTGNFSTSGTFGVTIGGVAYGSTDAFSLPLINGIAADGQVGSAGGIAWYKTFSSSFTGAASATLAANNNWVCNSVSFKTQ